METKSKLLRANCIERNEDGRGYNVASCITVGVDRINLFYTFYEPFDENGLPSLANMLFCDDYIQKECVVFLN